MNKDKRGFTLIELLTTMTIIAVLAGLALVSYQGARKAARDGKRKADLEEIRSALEMCYADFSEYPGTVYNSVTCDGKTYLDSTPKDPATDVNYYYSGSASSYILCAILEIGGTDTCAGCADCNYKVTNP